MSQRLVRKSLNRPWILQMLPVEEDDTSGGRGGGTEDEKSKDEDDTGGDTSDKDKDKGTQYSKEEYEALKARMIAADRAKTAAEQRVKEFENKDKSEIDKAKADLDEATAERERLKQEVHDLRIHNAFLASNKYQWHNPERALKLADLSDVVISDDGEVTGLDKALERLSKSDPYLIKSEDSGDSGDTPKGSTGAPVGSGGKGAEGKNREKLLEKYPALRR